MKILALDIATVTGVAVGDSRGNSPLPAWSVDLGKAKSEDHRFSQALVLMHKLIVEHKPDLIAVEAAVGGPKTSHFLVGLLACIRGCAANRGVPIRTYPINSIRKHFLGKALAVRDFPHLSPALAKKQIKATVMQRCRMLGWEFTDDNAADALALLDFARATEGAQTIPSGGLFK